MRSKGIAEVVLEGHGHNKDNWGLTLQLVDSVRGKDDVPKACRQFLDVLGKVIHPSWCALLELDPQTRKWEKPSVWSLDSGGELAPDPGLVQRVQEVRKAVLWLKAEPYPSTKPKDAKKKISRSLMAVPLNGSGRPPRFLYLESKPSNPFAEHQLQLTATAAAILELALDRQHSTSLRQQDPKSPNGARDHGLIGDSQPVARLRDFIDRVARVDSTVLLYGESGTGKELVARAIHLASLRSRRPLVAINCATLSETLLESELFGHERGAFTGASVRRIGKLEAANHGTLFLDEVGELPLSLQARLLRVLQERTFERVGSNQPIQVDIRIVAATNRNLEMAIQDGTFRTDLFHRLDVVSTQLPPLRQRPGDLLLLAHHFLRRHGERLRRPLQGIDPTARRLLESYPWPGNVRQLSNVIERAVVLGDGNSIRPEDLPPAIAEQQLPTTGLRADSTGGAEELSDYQTTITETKRRLLATALEMANGNAAEAGRRLGLHPNSFRRLVRRLGLK